MCVPQLLTPSSTMVSREAVREAVHEVIARMARQNPRVGFFTFCLQVRN